jgi:endonuclease G, mitochondrial
MIRSYSLLLFLLVLFGYHFLIAQSSLPKEYYPNVSCELIEHTFYALDYNEDHEQANWVIYYAGYQGASERDDHFRPDPNVSTQSAQLKDYLNSGYDRGHLAPAADMSISDLSMSESFFLSNMSPQLPSFNRGIWKELESLVRSWSLNTTSEYDVVITGPILTESCGTIGHNVTVPCRYFKIYADTKTCQSIGFILKNEASDENLTHFVVSIDQIEAETGIDFFSQLGLEIQSDLESQMDTSKWVWKVENALQPKSLSPVTDLQCNGITQSGTRCTRKATSNGFCWQHD